MERRMWKCVVDWSFSQSSHFPHKKKLHMEERQFCALGGLASGVILGQSSLFLIADSGPLYIQALPGAWSQCVTP